MIKTSFLLVLIVILISFGSQSCKQKGAPGNTGITNPIDSSLVTPFFNRYPALKNYEKDLVTVYRNYEFKAIWFDEKGLVKYSNSFYSKVQNLEDEGISVTFPYQKNIDGIFADKPESTLSITDAELLLTSLYLFYVEKVYKGIDDTSTASMGWLLPRKKVSYTGLLDSFISDQKTQTDDSLAQFSQYFKLRDVLKHYREIKKKGGWNPIELNPELKEYKPDDTAKAIQQIRERLFITGEIKQNNKSNRYDPDLVAAVIKYKVHSGYKPTEQIKPEHIRNMNVSVNERIKTIVVNMERCRWISPETINAKEYIFVNIPSYEMKFIRDGKVVFDSPVVVGKKISETAIFSGIMSYIIFSPYWNLPKTIIDAEIKPAIAKDSNYLVSHNMEWNKGMVRQKPGKHNSLGLVKFMFPNSHEIYFHDTPSKSHFKKDYRALSHGCVRVGKPRELALAILKNDKKWTPEKIDAAMNAGEESICSLKNKIPVNICYFTAWVDEQGEINFYKDVYERDERLALLLFIKN